MDQFERLCCLYTAQPSKTIGVSKCNCGAPVCDSHFISITRSDGRLDREEAEFIQQAYAMMPVLIAAAKHLMMREACGECTEAEQHVVRALLRESSSTPEETR